MGCLYRLSSTTRQCKEFPTTSRLSHLPRANGVACQEISGTSNIYIYTVYYIYYYFFCSFWLLFFIIRHTFTGKVNSKGNRQQMSTAISLLAGGVTTKEVTTPMVGLATTTVDQGRTNQVREWDGEWDLSIRELSPWEWQVSGFRSQTSFLVYQMGLARALFQQDRIFGFMPFPTSRSPGISILYHTIPITIYLYHSISPISADVFTHAASPWGVWTAACGDGSAWNVVRTFVTAVIGTRRAI